MTYISADRRKKSATVRTGGKHKFPVDSPQTAKSAARLIPNAKPPLSEGQKAAVMRKVHTYLPDAKAAGQSSSSPSSSSSAKTPKKKQQPQSKK